MPLVYSLIFTAGASLIAGLIGYAAGWNHGAKATIEKGFKAIADAQVSQRLRSLKDTDGEITGVQCSRCWADVNACRCARRAWS